MRAILLRLGTLLALIAGAASAGAAPTIIALQDDRLTTWPPETIDQRAALIAETGATWTRVDVLWRDIAPTRPENPADPTDPAYRWARLDAALRALGNRDVRVLFAVYYSPAWATGGRDDPSWAPDREQYGAFMEALGRRYSGSFLAGLQPAPGPPLPKVTHFEVWNEPNLDFFFRPQWRKVRGEWRPASPGLYARLVKAADRRLSRVRPDALLIVGALGPTTTTHPPLADSAEGFTGIFGVEPFVRALVRADVPAGAVSQHVYPGAEPGKSRAIPSIRGIPRLLELWDELEPGLPLYITEAGYTTAPNPNREYAVSERTQADYLPRLLRGLAGPRVRMVVWYHLQDHRDWASGLLAEDGRRKPSWEAFARTQSALER